MSSTLEKDPNKYQCKNQSLWGSKKEKRKGQMEQPLSKSQIKNWT